MRRAAPSGSTVHFTIEPPQNTSLYPFDTKGIALSPDGTMVVFAAEDVHSKASLYVRHLATTQTTVLAGTEDASYPFWSPDSRQLGFFAKKLHRTDVAGGPIVTICDAPSGRGGTWSRNGVIVFAPALAGELYRVSAAGGRPERVTRRRSEGNRQRWPWFLPDGKRFSTSSTQTSWRARSMARCRS